MKVSAAKSGLCGVADAQCHGARHGSQVGPGNPIQPDVEAEFVLENDNTNQQMIKARTVFDGKPSSTGLH